jgi:hypothetical protein
LTSDFIAFCLVNGEVVSGGLMSASTTDLSLASLNLPKSTGAKALVKSGWRTVELSYYLDNFDKRLLKLADRQDWLAQQSILDILSIKNITYVAKLPKTQPVV